MEATQQRKKRRDTGTRLTERDLLALRIMGEQYAIRFDQLQALLGKYPKAETKETGILSDSATRHAVTRWEAAGLVESKKILADAPSFHWLTTEGLHAVNLPFRRFTPKASQLNHIYWAAQARLYFVFSHPNWQWQSERWLRQGLDQKVKAVKLPDAMLQLEDSRVIAIELELTLKNAKTLQQIIQDRAMTYGQTWYFASKATEKGLNSAVQHIDEIYQQRIKVYSLDTLMK